MLDVFLGQSYIMLINPFSTLHCRMEFYHIINTDQFNYLFFFYQFINTIEKKKEHREH